MTYKTLKDAQDFELLICDIWGVIHNGERVFKLAVEALTRFKKERNGRICLLTNAPRSQMAVHRQLGYLGFDTQLVDGIVTSGYLTGLYIQSHYAYKTAFFIGSDADKYEYEQLGVTITDSIDRADYILVTGTHAQIHTIADYESIFQSAIRLDKLLLCANPDLVVDFKDKLVICAGSVAQFYEQLGGRVQYFGKPYESTYAAVFKLMEQSVGLLNPRALCIGDSLSTDITGANRAGLPVFFINNGVEKATLGQAESFKPDRLTRKLQDKHLTIWGYNDQLVW